MNTIKLGNKVKDRISGFSGIATAKTTYLNGCVRVLIEPDRLDEDGKLFKSLWFDEVQVVSLMYEDALEIQEKSKDVSGGPERPVPSSRDPE